MKISGIIDPSLQKYWSIVVYDEYGLPLPQYIYDDIAKRRSIDENSSLYEYQVRLTRCPKQSATADFIDISSCPKGYVLFRIVHPTSDLVHALSAPCAELVCIKDKSD